MFKDSATSCLPCLFVWGWFSVIFARHLMLQPFNQYCSKNFTILSHSCLLRHKTTRRLIPVSVTRYCWYVCLASLTGMQRLGATGIDHWPIACATVSKWEFRALQIPALFYLPTDRTSFIVPSRCFAATAYFACWKKIDSIRIFLVTYTNILPKGFYGHSANQKKTW